MPKRIITHAEFFEAQQCRAKTIHAIHIGRLVRPKRCEECGKKCRPEIAHYNYQEPYRVRWLCKRCHEDWDKNVPKRPPKPRDRLLRTKRAPSFANKDDEFLA